MRWAVLENNIKLDAWLFGEQSRLASPASEYVGAAYHVMRSIRIIGYFGILFGLVGAYATPAPAQNTRLFRVAGPIPTYITELSGDGFISWTNSATNASFTVQRAVESGAEISWVEYIKVPTTNAVTRHRLFASDPPAGMELIPAGVFTMGNCMVPNEGEGTELPLHEVYVSAFYMDRGEITKSLWDEVAEWSYGNGYVFDNEGKGKGSDHPVHSISWWDCVVWCNARSQKEGLTPCYYTDAALSNIHKTARVQLYVNWNANGYRLPTEAEWEKAARGGAVGRRFPWHDADTVDHSRANFNSMTNYFPSYDTSFPRGYHPSFAVDGTPFTSPSGSFAPNGYGLYDMAGNVWEWCWDAHSSSYYSSSPYSDPRGPASPSYYQVVRGGSWANTPYSPPPLRVRAASERAPQLAYQSM